jgi:hypothetical protein
MVNSRYLVWLIVLALTLIALPHVSALGCCLHGNECQEENSVVLISGQSKALSEEVCQTGLAGTWNTNSCDNVPGCAPVCCCNAPTTPGGDPTGGIELPIAFCTGTKLQRSLVAGQTCAYVCDNKTKSTFTVLTSNASAPGIPPLVGATVTLTAFGSPTPLKTNTSNITGKCTFANVPVGHYTLAAAKGSCTASLFIATGSPVQYSLFLTCPSSGGTDTCTPNWKCTYNSSDKTCGRYDKCVDQACGLAVYPGPLPEVICGLSFCNPDGQLDEGEDCDVKADGTIISSQETACSGYGMEGGTVLCSACKIDASRCFSCPANPTVCTKEQCDKPCDACIANGLCSLAACTDAKPAVTSVTAVQETSDVTLTWNLDQACLSSLQEAFVTRMDDETDEETMFPLSQEQRVSRLFVDEDLEPGKKYCYTITALVKSGGTFLQQESQSVCITMGDEECMQPHPAEVCAVMPCTGGSCTGTAARASCDDDNLLKTIEQCAGACTGPDSQEKTACVDVAVCDWCGGLYGMYAHLSQTVGQAGNDSIDCDSFPGTVPLCTPHHTQTIKDTQSSCSQVKSCYDYTTSSSCTGNACDHAALVGACEWRNLTTTLNGTVSLTAQAGIGICRPVQATKQSCEACNDQDAIFPACTAWLCGQYAANSPTPRCFFNTRAEGLQQDELAMGACISQENMACSKYADQASCTNGTNASVAVVYDGIKRISGTNTLSPSNDLMDLGTCRWTGAAKGCIKDADGKGSNDDCFGSGQDLSRCGSDHQPPVTDISFLQPKTAAGEPLWDATPVYSLKTFSFFVKTSDNKYPSSTLTTFYNLATNAAGGYPTLLLDSLKALELPSGTYTLSYYSEDPSHNLEVVKTSSVIIDSTPPAITSLNITNTSKEVYDDDWRTDVTVSFSATDVHGPLVCTTSLETLGEEITGATRTFHFNSGQEINETYRYLKDGEYTFTIECTDHPFLGNTNPLLKNDFEIKNDRSLTTSPSRIVFKDVDSVTLEAFTAKNATCTYSKTRINFTGGALTGESFSTTDGFVHNKTIAVTEEVYLYYVGCKFEDGKVKINNLNDLILFAVDDSAPTTSLLENGKPYARSQQNASQYVESLSLAFSCVDNALQPKITGWDPNFGPKQLEYCLTTGATVGCSAPIVVPLTGATTAHTFTAQETASGKRSLSYRCVDAGGNAEGWKQAYLTVRDLNFDLSDVEVCTRTGECQTPR